MINAGYDRARPLCSNLRAHAARRPLHGDDLNAGIDFFQIATVPMIFRGADAGDKWVMVPFVGD